MNSIYFSIQSQSSPIAPSGVVPSASTIVTLFLFLFFAFTLIANVCKHSPDQEEDSIEIQRQMLERIWNASSSKH